MATYAEVMARQQIAAARRARQEAQKMDTTPTHAAEGLTPDQCMLLDDLQRAIGARTWCSVADVQRAAADRVGAQFDGDPEAAQHVPTYDRLRRDLYALADRGLLRASPKGQPPGIGGLLFRLTPAGYAALIDCPPAYRHRPEANT
jgi:hypothetical protein